MPGSLNVYYRTRKQGLTRIGGIASLYSAYQKECRGRSPLPGFGDPHLGDTTAGLEKLLFHRFVAASNERNRSAEDKVLCRGSGCPRKTPFHLFAAEGGKSK